MLITINESKCVGLEVVQDDLMTLKPDHQLLTESSALNTVYIWRIKPFVSCLCHVTNKIHWKEYWNLDYDLPNLSWHWY